MNRIITDVFLYLTVSAAVIAPGVWAGHVWEPAPSGVASVVELVGSLSDSAGNHQGTEVVAVAASGKHVSGVVTGHPVVGDTVPVYGGSLSRPAPLWRSLLIGTGWVAAFFVAVVGMILFDDMKVARHELRAC